IIKKFNEKFASPEDDPERKLPHNPPKVPDGGGGCEPKQPDRKQPPESDEGDGPEPSSRKSKLDSMYRKLTENGADMHPTHFASWLVNALFSPKLRARLMDKLLKGEPLTAEDVKEMDEELANPENQKKISEGLEAMAAALDKQPEMKE